MVTSKMTMLGYSQFIEAEQEYQKVKKSRNHIFWYQLYKGPSSIKKLAEHLGESAVYEMYHGGHSASIHGTRVMHGLYNKPAEGMTEFVQIRYGRDTREVTKEALTFSFSIYNLYLQNRIPEKRKEFIDLYLLLRDDYLSI
ncbi:hypothetical protein QE390_005083 [Siphonobacter sp. SORGH_AS 1065]|nr:hypothetical protein [Siphonobacter sp. SORGH_AS_1065]